MFQIMIPSQTSMSWPCRDSRSPPLAPDDTQCETEQSGAELTQKDVLKIPC